MKSLLSKNWLVYKISDDFLQRAARTYAYGKLLDIGCGEKPYKRMFSPYVTDHVGLDHVGTLHDRAEIDLCGTAYEIPVEDESYDTILCSAVLEHLEEPGRAISEMRRVLKGNGIVILTAPLFWHLHEEPRDFYRYTKYGLKYLFEKAGFEIVELHSLSGFWVTFGQELVYYLWRFNRGRISSRAIGLLSSLIQVAAYIANRHDKSDVFTWMYLVVGRKALNRQICAP